MNQSELDLVRQIVLLMLEAGLCERDADGEFYLTSACVTALTSFPEGQHFLKLLRGRKAIELIQIDDEEKTNNG